MTMHKIAHDSETPAAGQQVFTACAFIWHDFDGVKKVFLPKRAATKKFLPSVYELPGGHIDYGEDLVEGLKREIMEELSMHICVGDVISAFTYMNDVKQSHSIEVIYFAQFTDPLANIHINSDDHQTYGWFSEGELPEVYKMQKGPDDLEYPHVKKAFALLKGQPYDYGSMPKLKVTGLK